MQAVTVGLGSNKPIERGDVFGRCSDDFPDGYERPKSRLGSARVTINVRGMIFETYEETLAQYPQTLLGNPRKRFEYFDPVTGHYCFDRNKFLFDSILFFYQSHGILAFPDNIPKESFIDEIKFFQLQDVDERIRKEIDSLNNVQELKPKEIILPVNTIKRSIWLLFEYPQSSGLAELLAKFSVFIIIASTITFCLETVQSLSHVKTNICFGNESYASKVANSSLHESNCYESKPHELWHTIEAVYVAWFTYEYVMRLFSAPNLCKFLKSPIGLVDILAILPYYITLISRGSVQAIPVLGIIRLLRVSRLLKLSRYSQGLKMLAKTLLLSAQDLPSMFVVMVINIILFSSVIYHAEQGVSNSDFQSIPDAFWWSVITMTTVGYGDQVPKGLVGRLVGALCAVSGIVILFCFPAPVLLSHFEKMYVINDKKKQGQNKKRKGSKEFKVMQDNVSNTTEHSNVLLDSQKSPNIDCRSLKNSSIV